MEVIFLLVPYLEIGNFLRESLEYMYLKSPAGVRKLSRSRHFSSLFLYVNCFLRIKTPGIYISCNFYNMARGIRLCALVGISFFFFHSLPRQCTIARTCCLMERQICKLYFILAVLFGRCGSENESRCTSYSARMILFQRTRDLAKQISRINVIHIVSIYIAL